MQRVQAAQARSRGYTMMGRFVAQGLCADMLPTLQQVAAVAAALPAHYAADAAAATHYEVFGRTIFAYESFFLSEAALRGGHASARVAATYGACGFVPADAQEADGLAAELACLAHLCAAEAEALEDRQTAAADRARTLQARLLADHLLCWLPPLAEGLQRLPDALYAHLGVLLWNFVADHAAALAPWAAASHGGRAQHPAPNVGAQATGLGEIAAWLLAPACAGFLITRDDLRGMAETLGASAGFGDRRTLLMDLLRTAGDAGALPALLNMLDARAAQAGAAYALMADDAPALASWPGAWIERTHAAHALLAAMRRA